MVERDLFLVNIIAKQVHPDYPEDDKVFAERLHLYSAGCYVAIDSQDGIVGYVFSHPWVRFRPIALNRMLGARASTPDTYWIHDIAILDPWRGRGLGRQIVLDLLGKTDMPTASLVSLPAADPFWLGLGFKPTAVPTDYAGGTFMERAL